MSQPVDALEFAPAQESGNPQSIQAAEKASLGFARRYLEQARELNECRREVREAWQERDHIFAFVVRNLITLAENCKTALAQASQADENLDRITLASVQRGVLHLLEELGVQRVDLLGCTYDGVLVDGEKIEDPFVVEDAERKGKMSEVVVREVVTDLWIQRRNQVVQVVQRGRVRC